VLWSCSQDEDCTPAVLLSAVLTSSGLEVSTLPEMDSSSYTIAASTDEAEEDDDDVRWLAVCAIVVRCLLIRCSWTVVLVARTWVPARREGFSNHSHSLLR
jgi:hypothetical protein